jgi:hypothetical protein
MTRRLKRRQGIALKPAKRDGLIAAHGADELKRDAGLMLREAVVEADDHNPIALETSVQPPDETMGEKGVPKPPSIDRWENEGGEIPGIPIPQPETEKSAQCENTL